MVALQATPDVLPPRSHAGEPQGACRGSNNYLLNLQMATEPYLKVGRGGAGNYYTPHDIQEVLKGRTAGIVRSLALPSHSKSCHILSINQLTLNNQDVEAQHPASPTTTAGTPSQHPEYIPSGRGGAGNFHPATTSSTSPHQPTNTCPSSSSDLASTSTTPSSSVPLYRGRGGAGNFNPSVKADEERLKLEKDDEERRVRQSVAEKVRRDVDGEGGLRRPEGVYLRPEGRSRAEEDGLV